MPITGLDFYFVPDSPKSGQAVSFFATITGGMAPFTYTWDFGDEATMITSTTTVAHNFPVTNTVQSYTAVLAAATSCSNQVMNKPVTINPWMIYLPVVMRSTATHSPQLHAAMPKFDKRR